MAYKENLNAAIEKMIHNKKRRQYFFFILVQMNTTMRFENSKEIGNGNIQDNDKK